MADTKPGPLPMPKYGGAAASAKPLVPGAPPIEAQKRLLPKAPKRKHAFNKAATAFTKGPLAFPKGG